MTVETPKQKVFLLTTAALEQMPAKTNREAILSTVLVLLREVESARPGDPYRAAADAAENEIDPKSTIEVNRVYRWDGDEEEREGHVPFCYLLYLSDGRVVTVDQEDSTEVFADVREIVARTGMCGSDFARRLREDKPALNAWRIAGGYRARAPLSQ